MTRQLTILISYIIILFTTVFITAPFLNYLVIALTLLFFGYQVYLFIQITKNRPDGEIVFKQHSKSLNLFFVILALIPTIGYFINGRLHIIQLTIFWALVVFDIVTTILTNKLKPVAIVINGNQLQLNNQLKTIRNLSSLKSLTLNGFTDEIKMTFLDQGDLLIKRKDFNNDDIQNIIGICVEKSKEHITISDNLKNNCR